MTHPARAMDFDTLVEGLERAVVAGNVRRSDSGRLWLSLYCYTQSCVYDKAWDQFSELARGLILDTYNRRVVATPFPKFFNVSERADTIPDLPFEIFEKLDGSLIILFWRDGEWQCATKGSFVSDQAQWAKEHLANFNLGALDARATYLCEAIYPQNRIVVQYPYQGLVLLAGYDGEGEELSYEHLTDLSKDLNWPIAQRHPVASISDLLTKAKALPSNEEGWVLRFANGHRLKVKGDEYLRLHRMISRLTPLAVWEAMMAGDDLVAYRRELPEEFWTDFDSIDFLLNKALQVIIDDTRAALLAVGEGLTDKDIGLRLHEFPSHVRRFVFPFRNHDGNLLQGRTRDTLFRAIRPTGNRLEGYEPSCSVVRFQEEAA